MATTAVQVDNSILTTREREIAQSLAEGLTVKKLAEQLGLSPKTVDTHKTNLMKKIDVHNRAQLTIWAVRAGLVKLEAPRT